MEEPILTKRNHTKVIYWTILFILVTVIIIGLGYFFGFVFRQDIPTTPNETPQTPQTPQILYDYGLNAETGTTSDITGTVALSILKKGDPYRKTLHLLDVSDENNIPKRTPRTQTRANNGTKFPGKNDPSVYYAVTSSATSSQSSDPYKVHRMDYKTKINEPVQITEGTFERHISWSPKNQLIAYTALPGIQTGDLDEILLNSKLSDWEIRILDPENGNERVVANGVHPMWSPDGEQILYPSDDGLYRYRLDVDSSEKVLNLANDGGGKISIVAKFGLSPNGRYLAWTVPSFNLIAIYEISSWEPFEIKEIGRIQSKNSQYYWPVFSPDSDFYIVQAIDSNGADEERSNARLEIRQTLGRNVLRTFSLEEYVFLDAFVDDWIE